MKTAFQRHGGTLTAKKPRHPGKLGDRQTKPRQKIEQVSLKLKTLLVAVDFSECSLVAVDYAGSLARQFGGQVELFHVVEPRRMSDSRYYYSVSDGSQKDTIKTRLSEIAEEKLESFVPVRADVQIGKAYEKICEAARRQKTDLIVIGTHGRTGLRRVFLGSTAERVVRHAPCSVLVVRDAPGNDSGKFAPKKILFPTDFSQGSKRSLGMAMAMAKQYNAMLHVLYVVPTYYPAGDADFFDYAALEQATKLAAEKDLVAIRKSILERGIKVQTLILHGRPPTEIVETAKRLCIDLIVLSTHGRTGFERVLLGSSTEEVVRYAPCPVLTWNQRYAVQER